MREVKIGFEEEFESLMAKKKALENEKQAAIAEAIEKLEERFKDRAKTINELLELISFEIPAEEAEQLQQDNEEVAETPAAEEAPTESEAISEDSQGGM